MIPKSGLTPTGIKEPHYKNPILKGIMVHYCWCMEQRREDNCDKNPIIKKQIMNPIKLQNSYNPWTNENDDELRYLFNAGMSVKEMAEVFKRTEGAITSRIARLGLNQGVSTAKYSAPKLKLIQNPKKSSTMNKTPTSKDLYEDKVHGRVRKHFKTGLEISEDGMIVKKEYSDPHTGDTKHFYPDILREADGREYVNWNDKKVYIDEMICACFKGSPRPGQTVVHIDGNISNSAAFNLRWS